MGRNRGINRGSISHVDDVDYWLGQWLDENGIGGLRAARRALKERRYVDALRERASGIPWSLKPLSDSIDDSSGIVAGRAIDLSGGLSCCHPDCLREAVDSLFSRVWYYFDKVVVTGLAPHCAGELFDNFEDFGRERILAFIDNFFYVRHLGAEAMLVYRQKLPSCTCHVTDYAEEYRAVSVLKQRNYWVEQIAVGAEIELSEHDDHWHYVVRHPDIEHLAQGTVPQPEKPGADTVETLVFNDVFSTYAGSLVSDIGTARILKRPLGTSVDIHGDLLTHKRTKRLKVSEALFELSLPYVDQLPARDLIKLRLDNEGHFEAFRSRLEVGARELIANAEKGVEASDIAREIKNDIIQPELTRIERQMKVAAGLMSGKMQASVVVGTLGTIVGLLGKMPLITAGGIAGIGSALNDYKNYIDAQKEVRMSDMYFLWNAMQRARHHVN